MSSEILSETQETIISNDEQKFILLKLVDTDFSVEIPENTTKREKIMLRTIMRYLRDPDVMKRLVPLLDRTSNISFRVLDWFVTNYSKKNNIIYHVNDSGKMRHFNVYIEYKQQLNAFNKGYFDPFNRSKRIYLNNDNIRYELTIGKLNFLHWADMYNIINYVAEHIDAIFEDMNTTNKTKKYDDAKKASSKSKRHPKRQLSVSAVRSYNKQDIKVVVSFGKTDE